MEGMIFDNNQNYPLLINVTWVIIKPIETLMII